jgi:PAS domain S-box-containing protein
LASSQKGKIALIGRLPVALLAFAAGAVFSIFAWHLTLSEIEREAQHAFSVKVTEIQHSIQVSLQTQRALLVALRGFIQTTPQLNREIFHRYISNLELASLHPNIRTLSYSVHLTAAQKSEFERRIRNDTSLDPRGLPDFAIKPRGDRPEYVILSYIEPAASNEAALGIDMLSGPKRLAASHRTRDTGTVTASGRVSLVSRPAEAGIILRLAVYQSGMPTSTVNERRAALIGEVGGAFHVRDLIDNVLTQRDSGATPMYLQVYDDGYLEHLATASPPQGGELLFSNLDADAGQSSYLKTMMVEVGGRQWRLLFSAPKSLYLTPPSQSMPWFVLSAGLAISLLLAGLIRSLSRSGWRAVELADRITADLRNSEAKLSEAQRMTQELIEALPNPIFFKGTDGRYLGVNKAWENFFGIPRSEFIGHTVHELYPHDQPTADRLHAMDQELWRSPGSQNYEANITPREGGSRDTIYYKATYQDSSGNVAGLIGTIVDITEHKKIEKALRDSESRYRSVIAAIAEGVIVRDRDARIVECNASAERILGLSIDQMRGNRYFNPDWETIRDDGSPFPADDRPVNAALRTGQLQSNVVTGFRRRTGGTLWLQLNAQPLFEHAGAAPSGVVTSITNITERKQAEQRQKMEHAVTRVLAEAEAAPGAIQQIIKIICETMGWNCGACWAWDEADKLLRCTECWGIDTLAIREFLASNTGYTIKPGPSVQGLVRQTFALAKSVWIADATQLKDMVIREPQLVKAGLHSAFAFPLLLGSKVIGVMEFFHRDIREPDDMLIRISQSIGSQIGQFIQRKETEQRYHTIFENAAVGITQIDLDGVLTDANQKFFNMLEYQREEVVGKHVKDFTHPDDYGQGAQWRKRLAEGNEKSMSGEKRFISKSGKVVWARRTMSVVCGNSGNPEYMISVVEDITDRKLAEQRQTMEHAVTRVLADAQTLAEASSRIIQTICETMGWHCGTCWVSDRETGLLRCLEAWGPETPEIREFLDFSLHRTFMPGADKNKGLIRRAVAEGKPVWITDIAGDKELQRAGLIAKARLHSFYGFPIMLGNEVLGAMEFFHRDIRPPDDTLSLVAQSIGSQVGQFIQRMRAEENLQFVATHDTLTELPNRYLFAQCLKQALSRAQRSNRMASVMFLDLDHFKEINDTLGHEAGDQVLRETAARLSGCVRKSDVVSRRGGDEFVVLIEDLTGRASLDRSRKKSSPNCRGPSC